MTDQDKIRQEIREQLCFVYGTQDDEAKTTIVNMALEKIMALLSGECFASEYILKVIEPIVMLGMLSPHETMKDIRKALSSIPRQLATEEEISKMLKTPIIDVIAKIVIGVDKSTETVFKGNCKEIIKDLREVCAKSLVGKIPRQKWDNKLPYPSQKELDDALPRQMATGLSCMSQEDKLAIRKILVEVYDQEFLSTEQANEVIDRQLHNILTIALNCRLGHIPAREEIRRLREFVDYILRDFSWEGCDVDGGDAQDKALELGLIELRPIKEEDSIDGEKEHYFTKWTGIPKIEGEHKSSQELMKEATEHLKAINATSPASEQRATGRMVDFLQGHGKTPMLGDMVEIIPEKFDKKDRNTNPMYPWKDASEPIDYEEAYQKAAAHYQILKIALERIEEYYRKHNIEVSCAMEMGEIAKEATNTTRGKNGK